MQELIEYREKLTARLREAADECCAICRAANDPFAIVEGEWTVHQIAFHLRDVNREVYGARIRRTLQEDNPEFSNFDPDVWMATHYKREETLEHLLDEFTADVHEVCDLLSALPQESWSRISRHQALGSELTLQLWAERSLAHLEEHLSALQNAKNA